MEYTYSAKTIIDIHFDDGKEVRLEFLHDDHPETPNIYVNGKLKDIPDDMKPKKVGWAADNSIKFEEGIVAEIELMNICGMLD